MSAAKYNLSIEKWATFKAMFKYRGKGGRPINLDYCSAKLQVRESTSSNVVLAEFSTENGHIKPLSTNGVIEFNVPPDVTGVLSFTSAIYDLVVTYSDGSKERLLEGAVNVVEGVTK